MRCKNDINTCFLRAGDGMDFQELVKLRRSSRWLFSTKKQISDEDLITILEAARHAPTPHNRQPFEIIVVKDRKIISAIRNFASTPQNVSSTDRARQDMVRNRLTMKGICQAIIGWIDEGNIIIQDLTYHEDHAGKFVYFMNPEIDGKKRYIKVSFTGADEQSGMIIVSAHEYDE